MQNTELRYKALLKELNLKALLDKASEQSSISDYKNIDLIEPLSKLLDCAAKQGDFHEQGLIAFKNDIVRCLVNRMRAETAFVNHPQILNEDVSDPIIIIGMGRSGTTKLQRMLSSAPDFHKLYLWMAMNPAPFPNTVMGENDPRITASLGTSSDDNPELKAAHVMTASEPDEDWGMYESTFDDWIWCVLHAPSDEYYDWVMQRPAIKNYEYVRNLLKYLQWQLGGKQEKPWVLKGIGHIANLDALLKCYPNATIVHAHRHPREALASFIKVGTYLWDFKVNSVDPKEAGRLQLKWWSNAFKRYMATRDRLKLDGRILDVPYQTIRDEPMPVMQEIYKRAGLTVTKEAEEAMLKWNLENEQGKHGSHQYSLEEYGLTEDIIDREFSEYIERYIN